jgi:hypothetical protein
MPEEPFDREELEEQKGELLPDREAMSLIRDPFQTPGTGPADIAPSEPLPIEPSSPE